MPLTFKYEKFKRDENFDIWNVVESAVTDIVGGTIFSKVGEVIGGGEAGGFVGGAIFSILSAISSENERVAEAKATNEYINELKIKHGERWEAIMLGMTDELRVELMIRGYIADISVKRDADGLIEDVICSNVVKQENFSFRTLYESFYQMNNNPNNKLPSPEEVTDFDSLSEDVQDKIKEYLRFSLFKKS